MNKICTIVLFCTLMFNQSFGQTFDWAVKGGAYEYDYGYGVATDALGNIYVAGKYEQNAKFSGTSVFCRGNHDGYVAKYSPTGALLWITTFGGAIGDYAHCLTIDAAGEYVYMGGEIEQTCYFNNSQGFNNTTDNTTVVEAKSDNDICVAKYKCADGSLVWAKAAGGYLNDKALGITLDASSNVYITGQIDGDVTKNPTFGNISVPSAGDKDMFIAKYNSDGVIQWAKRGGSEFRDEGKAISAGTDGIYVTGFFSGTATFDGTSGNVTVTASPNSAGDFFDMYLAKYDFDGKILFVKTAGGEWDDVGWGITVGPTGKVFITGEFNGDATFGTNKHIYSTAGAQKGDAFIACYDANGDFQWVNGDGGKLSEVGQAIATDAQSNVYVTGRYGDTATFATTQLFSKDSTEIFIASYKENGDFRWALSAGGGDEAPDWNEEGARYESGFAITVDNTGAVIVTGSYLGVSAFGSTQLPFEAHTEMFLTKISQAGFNGIGEDITKNSFKVYPNPNSGRFNMDFNLSEKDVYTIELHNMMGQVVYSEKLNNLSGTFSKEVDASAFTKGVYFLRIVNSKNNASVKKVTIN